ncbi:MAG: hypothetical protein AAGB31_05640, partial [Bdellovibrio sp.]
LDDLVNGNASEMAAAQATLVDITSSIQTVYSVTCGGSSSSGSDICKQINTAVSQAGVDIQSTDPADLVALGVKLLEEWQN